jgi:hypothetical protein
MRIWVQKEQTELTWGSEAAGPPCTVTAANRQASPGIAIDLRLYLPRLQDNAG